MGLQRSLSSAGHTVNLSEGSTVSSLLCQYASLLAAQGVLKTAVSYLNSATQVSKKSIREGERSWFSCVSMLWYIFAHVDTILFDFDLKIKGYVFSSTTKKCDWWPALEQSLFGVDSPLPMWCLPDSYICYIWPYFSSYVLAVSTVVRELMTAFYSPYWKSLPPPLDRLNIEGILIGIIDKRLWNLSSLKLLVNR